MRISGLLWACAAVVALIGCEPAAESPTELPTPSNEGEITTNEGPTAEELAKYGRILPAQRLSHEYKQPGKADVFDDQRALYKKWFAITEPPTGDFRPMVEWEPMQALWTTYSDYVPGNNALAQTIVDIIYHTVVDADTTAAVVVDSNSAYNNLVSRLQSAGLTTSQINNDVIFYRKENDSIWFIDYGMVPMVRNDGKVAFADFRYYHPRVLDDALSTRIGWDEYDANTYRMPIDTEGGNFMYDGNGNCFTSERGLAIAGLTEAQFEAVWAEYMNCSNLVVLKDITDDGTGHIDMFFKQVDGNTAIMGEYLAPYVNDPTNKARMDDNADLLESLIGTNGLPMTVYRMPMPSKAGGIPRTYINSTFVNGVNLWPIYSNSKGAEALAEGIWETAMPGYEHIGINCDEIAQFSGTIHCITRTVPVGSATPWIGDGSCSGAGGTCSAPAGGYTGTCEPGYNDNLVDDIPCRGPEWLCECPDCNACEGGVIVGSSCAGVCGTGAQPSGCYCDEACEGYGDCCGDYAAECTGAPVGGCDGFCGTQSSEGCWCDSQCSSYGDCCSNYEDLCLCEPDCAGKACGDDGCGGSCGGCGASQSCNAAGQCVSTCTPDCAGKECGSNGCGGSCGSCGAGETCNAAGTCDTTCTPDCAGKECGDNGCGGVCGSCDAGESCNAAGTCEAVSGPTCAGSCGAQSPDGCYCDNLCTMYGDCCPDYQAECVDGPAESSCAGVCDSGQQPSGCYCDDTCEGYGDCCSDYVDECGSTCTPDCSGKECGDDGCGGECGACEQAPQCVWNGDLNTSGETNINDVQCALLITLASIGSNPMPTCAGDTVYLSDLDCNFVTNVVDVNILISKALGTTLNSAIDSNGDGCTNACEAAVSCTVGACEYPVP